MREFILTYAADPGLSPERRAQEDFAECYRVVMKGPQAWKEKLEEQFASLISEHGDAWEDHVKPLEVKYFRKLQLAGMEPNT